MDHISSRRTKSKPLLFFGIAVAVSFLFGVWFRNIIPVAIVDGQLVKRSEFISLLLERGGKDTMQRIVVKKFINDEARRRKVTVTKQELDAQLKIITDQLTREKATLAQYLTMQNVTERQFMEEMELQMKVKKMFGPNVVVTQKEIDNYLVQNKIARGKGAVYQSQKIDIEDKIFKQKLQDEFRLFVADRLKKARVHYFIKL